MSQSKTLNIDVTVSEKENATMQVKDSEGVNVSPQDVVKVTTNNYNDLQNLPTIDGEPVKGEISGQIEALIPEVPEWAMQQEPPTYTSDDVGAVSKDDFDVEVGKLNESILEANKGIESNSKGIAELIRADSVLDKKKVDKVAGKGLSTNDLTDELLEKINKDEQNVQADWNESNSASDAFIKNKPESMPASDVYSWAKAAQKPSYTAEEVGALPEDTTTITPEQAQQIEDNAEQIVKVKEDVVVLDKRVDDIAITQTFSGSSILAEGTSNNLFRGLKLFGKSTQNGTPSPENPVPIVSAGDNGQIEVGVYGGNLADFQNAMALQGTVTVSENSFSWIYDENSPSNQRIVFVPCVLKKGHKYVVSGTFSSNLIRLRVFNSDLYLARGVAFIPTSDESEVRVYVNVNDYGEYEVKNFVVNAGESPLPYESYKQPQTLSYSTPNGLPGIPVFSGGNYTDENGQQWVCDEVDFRRGVYVKRIEIIEEYNGESVKMPYMSTTGDLTVGAKILYVLNDSEETPITPAELFAYTTIHTNYPTITVMNNVGAGMECKCEMETKSYIEKNFVSKSELKGMVEQILSQNASETVYSDEEYGV